MAPPGEVADGNTNGTESGVYSPVTLNQEWSIISRLMFMALSSCVGTIVNGFFVSSFFVDDNLKRLGNVFLACIGLCDLIITGCVMPVVSVVLLSGTWDSLTLCNGLQFLTEASTYCYSCFFVMIAIEAYMRLCRSTTAYDSFLSMHLGVLAIFIFVIGFCVAGAGVYLKLDYDYCTRQNNGNLYFRIATTAIFHAIPFLMIVIGLLTACIKIRSHAQHHVYYRRSLQYELDNSTVVLNLTVYLMYVGTWIPYLVIVYLFPTIINHKYFACAWLGVYRAMFPAFFYCTMHRNFRNAFGRLYYYCFCKRSTASTQTCHHRRGRATGQCDVRVHILHQVVPSHKRYPGTGVRVKETRKL